MVVEPLYLRDAQLRYVLLERGQGAAGRRLAGGVAARGGSEFGVAGPGVPLLLTKRAETDLFRVLQEALHNSAKHAPPGHIESPLCEPADAARTLVVEIADD